jgi:putative ABC transport system substrate-binding protein
MMDRRDALIVMLALGAAAGPIASNAQQPAKMRRIGVLTGFAENDPSGQLRLAQFKEHLATLGWTEGRNVSIEVRWGAGDVDHTTGLARELIALQPDVIVSSGTPATAALQRGTSTIPIVFVSTSDPVGSGFVKTLSHPGGNITGLVLDSRLMEKWLELLKEVAPRVTRVAVMFNPDSAPYAKHYMGTLTAAAPKQGASVREAPVRNESDMQEAVTGLAREPGGGLVVMPDYFMLVHRKSVIALTARHKVPAIFSTGPFVQDGGLISYGTNSVDLFRRSAIYVDRILRGAKPAELPVGAPEKYELLVNLRTARELGLTIPPSVLLRADEVIQ